MEGVRKSAAENQAENGDYIGFGQAGAFDEEIYGGGGKKTGSDNYHTSIGGDDDNDEDEDDGDARPGVGVAPRKAAYRVSEAALRENAKSGAVSVFHRSLDHCYIFLFCHNQ